MTNALQTKVLNQLALYGMNLLFNTLLGIVAFSYVPLTNDFSVARGWRTFTELFGGFWGMIGSTIVLLVVIGLVGYAVNATLPRLAHRWAVGGALFLVIVLAAIFGQAVFSALATGKTLFIIGFLSVVAVETASEWWLARRKHARVTNSR